MTTHEGIERTSSFDDECDHEIERLFATGATPEELACKGVQSMIAAACDNMAINMGGTCGCDPAQTQRFGELLFIRALEELKARRT